MSKRSSLCYNVNKVSSREVIMGRHPIEKYLFNISRTKKDFSNAIGVTANHLYAIIIGRRRASVDLAFRIEKETKGFVKAISLLKPKKK